MDMPNHGGRHVPRVAVGLAPVCALIFAASAGAFSGFRHSPISEVPKLKAGIRGSANAVAARVAASSFAPALLVNSHVQPTLDRMADFHSLLDDRAEQITQELQLRSSVAKESADKLRMAAAARRFQELHQSYKRAQLRQDYVDAHLFLAEIFELLHSADKSVSARLPPGTVSLPPYLPRYSPLGMFVSHLHFQVSWPNLHDSPLRHATVQHSLLMQPWPRSTPPVLHAKSTLLAVAALEYAYEAGFVETDLSFNPLSPSRTLPPPMLPFPSLLSHRARSSNDITPALDLLLSGEWGARP